MKNLLPVFILLLLGCSNQTVDQQSEAQKIMNLSREWAKSAGTGNLERTLSYWADNAVCLFPDLPPIKGKEEIRQCSRMFQLFQDMKLTGNPRTRSFL